MSAHSIASKFRRAIRLGTGATFTNEQLKEMASYGILRDLALIEADALCPPAQRDSKEETITQQTNLPSPARHQRKRTEAEGRAFLAALSKDL